MIAAACIASTTSIYKNAELTDNYANTKHGQTHAA